MKLINLTPHPITIAPDGDLTTATILPPSGQVARVAQSYEDAGDINGIPVVTTAYGAVQVWGTDGSTGALPPEDFGVAYIVSGMILSATQGRNDLFAHDSGSGAIRDDAGRIVGVKRLIKA